MAEPSADGAAASLQALVDRVAITDLIYRYSRAVDRLDADLLRSVYWPDGTDDHGIFTGSAPDYVDWVMGFVGGWISTHHDNTNILIELDGDVAYGECHWTGWYRRREGEQIVDQVSAGRYLDRFERRDGEWRILQRVCVSDWSRSAAYDGELREHRLSGRRGHDDLVYQLRELRLGVVAARPSSQEDRPWSPVPTTSTRRTSCSASSACQSTTTLAERAEAAQGAGYDGMGLRVRDAPDIDLGLLVDTLAEHDLVLSELEGCPGWGTTGTAFDECRLLEEGAYRVADATGARHMQVWGSYEGDLNDAAKAFGDICDRAADHGMLIALEFLPFTNVPDARTGMEIVERAGRPNGGLCASTSGTTSGEPTPSSSCWPSRPSAWSGVQFDDGATVPVNPDYYDDCRFNRVPPGEGDFDLVTFLRTLREIGADAPIAVEVLSDKLEGRSAADVANELMEATRKVRLEAWGV